MAVGTLFLRRRRGGIRPTDRIWVAGHPWPIPFAAPARGADLTTLVKEEQLSIDRRGSAIGDALFLAGPVNRGTLAPAVAGAWAAVESLLKHPDDPVDEERSGKAVAADRFAAIVACSWPRAELTSLSHRHRPRRADALADALTGCRSNAERARAVARTLETGTPLDLESSTRPDSDRAAAQRMTTLLADPRAELAAATRTIRVTMRRLYRTRNIVLHGGSTEGVALQASLRTAAPLFGAGLDRMIHADLVESLHPLDLAARARLALELVDGETGLAVTDLLSPVSGASPGGSS